MNIAEALRKLIEMKGIAALNDRSISTAVLLDLMMGDSLTIRRFTFLYDVDAIKDYIRADYESSAEKKRVITKTMMLLEQMIGLTPQISETIANYLPEALKWRIGRIAVNESNFPDPIFRKYISDHYDNDRDGYLEGEEISKIRYMDLSVLGIQGNLKGIAYFDSLEILDCSSNDLKELDLNENIRLKELYCSYNQHLRKLKIDKCINLIKVQSEYCPIEETDSNQVLLIDEFSFPDPLFREFVRNHYDIDHDDKLSKLETDHVRYMDLSVQGIRDIRGIGYFEKLEVLDCSSNCLQSLSLNQNTELKELYCSFNPQLKRIEAEKCSKLKKADIEGCSLDVKNMPSDVQYLNYFE